MPSAAGSTSTPSAVTVTIGNFDGAYEYSPGNWVSVAGVNGTHALPWKDGFPEIPYVGYLFLVTFNCTVGQKTDPGAWFYYQYPFSVWADWIGLDTLRVFVYDQNLMIGTLIGECRYNTRVVKTGPADASINNIPMTCNIDSWAY